MLYRIPSCFDSYTIIARKWPIPVEPHPVVHSAHTRSGQCVLRSVWVMFALIRPPYLATARPVFRDCSTISGILPYIYMYVGFFSMKLTSFKALMNMEPIVSTDTILLILSLIFFAIRLGFFRTSSLRFFLVCCSPTERRRLTVTNLGKNQAKECV